MSNSLVKQLFTLFLFANSIFAVSQSTWPSKTWDSAVNISSLFPTSVAELSGMYWNSATNRLYCVADEGVVYILTLNKTTNTFSLTSTLSNMGGPEGVTMVNNALNEFYTIDENSYEIRKYTHNADFSGLTKSKYWSLLQSPSPMSDTGNTGPEGIAFVPESYLSKIGFISSATRKAYTSAKGMGGLIFISHQDGGYVWVFDINPSTSNDFLYVGKYKTNRTECCDLTFDQSTGLLYILHNTGDNYLEITDLKTTVVSSEYKLNTLKEYFIPNPTSGSNNVEGFAMMPKYPDYANVSAWLCRDVKASSSDQSDCIRWFYPFSADGSDIRTSISEQFANSVSITVQPNPASTRIVIDNQNSELNNCYITLYSPVGQLISNQTTSHFPFTMDISNLKNGIYLVKITSDNKFQTVKTFIKTND
ncbi:MAG: T9SS type A sorting domain-containing protein [Paludibacter sp.]